jgi:tetratricopeptide (TPR) repeat protein
MTSQMFLSAAILILSALTLCAHDDLDGQIAEVSAAIDREPGNAGLLLRRAELHRLHGDQQQALVDVTCAKALGTLTSGIDRQLARILMDQQDYRGAYQAFTRHLADCPHDGDARSLRATCAQRLGDPATALSDLEAAVALLHRPDPDLLCQIADLLHDAGRSVEAINRLDAAILKDGAIPAYNDKALQIERATQRFTAALTRLERLTSTGQARWMVEHGDLLVYLGRMDEARVTYQAAATAVATLPPSRRAAQANVALLYRIESALATTLATTRTTAP